MTNRTLFPLGRRWAVGALGAAWMLLLSSSLAAPASSPSAPPVTVAPVIKLQPSTNIPPVEKPRIVTRFRKLVEASSLINATTGRTAHNVDGSGLCAAILDTGINTTHSDFAGKIVLQKNYTSNNGGNTSNAEDGQGHGTNVAGIVAGNGTHIGIAPGAKLAVFKVLANTGSGSSASIASALQWILDNGDSYNISVVCMSLGDGGNYQTENGGDPYRSVIQQLRAKNIAVVVAAGNSFYPYNSVQGMASPAIDRECISVGAVYDANIGGVAYGDGATANTTAADRITPFSQRLHSSVSSTNRTDIFAPGAALTSAGLGSTTASSTMHGTSQAAPIIAGSVLLFQQKYKAVHGSLPSTDALETLMRDNGHIINDGDDEDDNVTHAGLDFPRVDVKATLDAIGAASPVFSITNASVTETVGGTTASLTVSVSPPPSGTATVNWATVDGTATADQDYTASNGTLTFSAAQTSQTITIPVLDDGFVESAETFKVHLSNGVGATVPSFASDGTVTITDNDTITIVTPVTGTTYPTSGGTYTVRTTTNSPGVATVKVYRRPMLTASSGAFAIPQDGSYGSTTVTISSSALARNAYLRVAGNHPAPSELSAQMVTPGGTFGLPLSSLTPSGVTFDLTSFFAGQSLAGNWTLRVTDNTNNSNSGSITSWAILGAMATGSDTFLFDSSYNSGASAWDGQWNVSSTPNGYYSLVSRSFNASGTQLGVAYSDRLLVQNSNQAPVVSAVDFDNLTPKATDSIKATVTASDPENATLTYNYTWSINGTAKRTISLSASATDTLSLPSVGAKGGDVVSLVVSVSDGSAASENLSPNSVTVVNSAPVPGTASASLATWKGRSLINRPDRASDADGNTLTWSAGTSPSHGTLTVDSSDGLFLYVPTGNYTGSDTFTLSVSDGAASASVSYSVSVVAAPASGTRIYTALGASDANGVGASDYVPTLTAAHGYTVLLEGKFKASEGPGGKWALSNRGVNGFTAPDLVRQVGGQSVLSLAVADGAAAYSLWIGPNDVLHISGFTTPAETGNDFTTAFSQVVGALKNTSGVLVVCNVSKVGDLPASQAYTVQQRAGADVIAQNLNTAIAGVCNPASVPIVDLYSDANSTAPANISADGFHPNDIGYQLLADKIWPYFTARVELAPYVVNVTPSTATTARGATQVFSIHVKDANGTGTNGLRNGASAIGSIVLLANKTYNWDGGVMLVYIPSSTDVTQGILQGRMNGSFNQSAIGTGGTIVQADGGSVDASQVSVTLDGDGAGFTVQLPITAGAILGQNAVRVRVQDPQNQIDLSAPTGKFGYVDEATWTITVSPASKSLPVLASVTPATGTTWNVAASGYSQVRTLTLGASDADGVNDIDSVMFIVGSARSLTNTGSLLYSPRVHALYLRNDAGTAWLGPVTVGATGAILENSAIRVDVSGSTESRTATSVSLPVSLQVKSALRGQPRVWARVADQSGALDSRGDDQGYILQGTWSVNGPSAQNSAPIVQSIEPNPSSAGGTAWTVGTEREAILDVSDMDGAQDIASAWFLAGTTLSWNEGATLIYTPSASNPTKGTLNLRGDNGFLPAVTINGSQSGILSNGHISVRLDGVSVQTTTDGHLALHLPLTFAANMAKTLKVWGRAQDKTGATDPAAVSGGYVQKSTWAVASATGAASASPSSAGSS